MARRLSGYENGPIRRIDDKDQTTWPNLAYYVKLDPVSGLVLTKPRQTMGKLNENSSIDTWQKS